MPFFDTPNPGVYKAWVVPLSRYIAKGGSLKADPQPLKVKGTQVGFQPDPGFGPPRDQVKTDNFKVREFFPPEIMVRKFHDINGNGIWDAGEPEIGVDQCVDETTGAIVTCPGGWPYNFTSLLTVAQSRTSSIPRTRMSPPSPAPTQPVSCP